MSGRFAPCSRSDLPSITWMLLGRKCGNHFSSSSAHTKRKLAGTMISSGHSSCTSDKLMNGRLPSAVSKRPASCHNWLFMFKGHAAILEHQSEARQDERRSVQRQQAQPALACVITVCSPHSAIAPQFDCSLQTVTANSA